jgi:hypothetical protein
VVFWENVMIDLRGLLKASLVYGEGKKIRKNNCVLEILKRVLLLTP